jgi:hypothetical protein
MRQRIIGNDSVWRKRLLDWLERCHTGDFVSGNKNEVTASIEELKERVGDDYIDPTQSLPIPPPIKCTKHISRAESEYFAEHKNCKQCVEFSEWQEQYKRTTDDILLRSNVHSCNRGTRKDGTRKKNKASAGCMDNKWGTCRARFPRATALKSFIDETGAITMKKLEPWINTFTPIVTYIFRCNTDVTCMTSGTAIKGVAMYVSDYITKSTLKTHVIFDSIRTVFQKNSKFFGETLPAKEKTRRFMTKVANLLSAKAEMGAPMIAMYLLGNPDHYTSHEFIPFYWQSYVQEVQRAFDSKPEQNDVPQKVTVIKRKGKIVGLSPIHDYVHRPDSLEDVSLYDWVRCYKREKLQKNLKKDASHGGACIDSESHNRDINLNIGNVFDEATASDVSQAHDLSDISLNSSDGASEDIVNLNGRTICKKSGIMSFGKGHPLHDSHGVRHINKNSMRVPNFAGANLPRCDQGDREYYTCTMLTLFKPWRKGTDLKGMNASWDDSFNTYTFSEEDLRLMKNFNIRYECLDARDDYRAQMKKGLSPIFGSWDTEEVEEQLTDLPNVYGLDATQWQGDDSSINPHDSGPTLQAY